MPPRQDGRAEALAPGMEVQSRDRIRTGEDARVYLKLVDGSTVKIGELLAERLGASEKNFFSGALDVAKGAFRFTTDKLRKLSRRGGKWRVVLGDADGQDGALDLYDRARQAGYAAVIRPRSEGEGYRYQVFIRSLPTRPEAEALAARVGPRLGLAARVLL